MHANLFNLKTRMPVYVGDGMVVLNRVAFLMPPTVQDIEYRCFQVTLADNKREIAVDCAQNGYMWLTNEPVFERQVPMFLQCIATNQLIQSGDQVVWRTSPLTYSKVQGIEARLKRLRPKEADGVYDMERFWLRPLYAAAG